MRCVSTALPSAQATGMDAGSMVGGASPAQPNEYTRGNVASEEVEVFVECGTT